MQKMYLQMLVPDFILVLVNNPKQPVHARNTCDNILRLLKTLALGPSLNTYLELVTGLSSRCKNIFRKISFLVIITGAILMI